jgi:hypothetical protein
MYFTVIRRHTIQLSYYVGIGSRQYNYYIVYVKMLFTLGNVKLEVRGVLIHLPSYEEKNLTFEINTLSMCMWGPSFNNSEKKSIFMEERFGNNVGELNRTGISLIFCNQ